MFLVWNQKESKRTEILVKTITAYLVKTINVRLVLTFRDLVVLYAI